MQRKILRYFLVCALFLASFSYSNAAHALHLFVPELKMAVNLFPGTDFAVAGDENDPTFTGDKEFRQMLSKTGNLLVAENDTVLLLVWNITDDSFDFRSASVEKLGEYLLDEIAEFRCEAEKENMAVIVSPDGLELIAKRGYYITYSGDKTNYYPAVFAGAFRVTEEEQKAAVLIFMGNDNGDPFEEEALKIAKTVKFLRMEL